MNNDIHELLPQPFAWCDIPAGEVVIKYGLGFWKKPEYRVEYKITHTRKFYVDKFRISKYPITNAQYDFFLNHKSGATNPIWWDFSKDAQRWWNDVNQNQVVYSPERFPKTRFDGLEMPRTNLTWYDAVAFCRFLSDLIGENIHLPTEQQWQYASQGNDERTYPWGNNWDETCCNNTELGTRGVTPVTQFECKGDSPYEVVDMVGNVWEWCSTEYDNGNIPITQSNNFRYYVKRGGSWGMPKSNSKDILCTYVRDKGKPHEWLNFYTGMRIVLSI